MKQMCKKQFQSPCVCRNELSNPCCLTLLVNEAPTTVRPLGLESSIQHTQGWLKLIFSHSSLVRSISQNIYVWS